MRNDFRFIFIFLLGIVSCTKGDPKLTEGKDFPLKLNLSQSSIVTLSSSISIIGTCDSRLLDIEMSFNDGVNWLNPSLFSSTYTNNCKSDGSFNIVFTPSHADLNGYFTDPLSQPWTKILKLRPLYSVGPGKTSNFTIKYEPQTPSSSPGMVMLAGYSDTQFYQSAGLTYNLRGRIGVQSHLPTNVLDVSGKIQSSGGNFNLKMGILKEVQ